MKTVITSLIFSSLLIFSSEIQAQEESKMDDIAFLADVTMNAMNPSHREIACQKLYESFKAKLNDGKANELNLDSIVWMSKLMPPDSSFTWISWQLEKKDKASNYYNFILYQDGSYTEFVDGGMDMNTDASYTIFEPEATLGMYYYKMIPTGLKDKSYFLFGFRNANEFEVIKTIDVLSFGEEGPILGKEMFEKIDDNGQEDIKTRLLMQYSSDSHASYSYNPETEMIMYDHLIARMGMQKGQGPTMLPDGSYEAYYKNKKKWIHKSKVFNQVSEEAPRPEPVLNERSKNIFGKG